MLVDHSASDRNGGGGSNASTDEELGRRAALFAKFVVGSKRDLLSRRWSLRGCSWGRGWSRSLRGGDRGRDVGTLAIAAGVELTVVVVGHAQLHAPLFTA